MALKDKTLEKRSLSGEFNPWSKLMQTFNLDNEHKAWVLKVEKCKDDLYQTTEDMSNIKNVAKSLDIDHRNLDISEGVIYEKYYLLNFYPTFAFEDKISIKVYDIPENIDKYIDKSVIYTKEILDKDFDFLKDSQKAKLSKTYQKFDPKNQGTNSYSEAIENYYLQIKNPSEKQKDLYHLCKLAKRRSRGKDKPRKSRNVLKQEDNYLKQLANSDLL